jgi:RNA pol II promoter Fmp27 protein domain
MRLEHEDAFDAKVAKIEAAAGKNANIRRVDEWNFTTEHSVGINEARHRLRELFSNMWINQVQDAKATAMAREESMSMRFRENKFIENESALPVSLYVPPSYPPLFRLTLNGVSASIRSPGWSGDQLASFMEDLGQGIPRDTEFTLLVPLHIELALDSARLVLRDLPLPIFNVPPCSDKKSLTFITDLVIGEEIGPASSVRWVRCDVAAEDADALGTAAFNMLIPKTTMPMKTYAQPEVKVSTTGITDMCWGVSFLPIMQEVMKVIDGLSTLPVDPSPGLGFWDKLRLIMHWRTNIQFSGEVHVHLKGEQSVFE